MLFMRTFWCLAVSVSAASTLTPLWLRADAPVDERVAALLSQMTVAEKMAQTIHLTGGDLHDVVKTYGSIGLGAFPSYGGSNASLTTRNALQAAIMGGSRLHIPVTFHEETLHGGCEGCVIFPMPAGQGSTWDTDIVHDIARVIATEAYAAGMDRGFSPELNVPGDARFGRTEENFGEDPAIVAAMGVAAVTGLHGGNTNGPSSYLPPFAIVSEAKHAAAYAFGGKDGAGTDVSERTLHDVYLRPWRAYAAAGGRGAMLAHNAINGSPCHSNAELMTWMRAQGNMSGAFFASDMCDVGLLRSFRVTDTLENAGILSMSAGLDQELCNPVDGRGQAFPLIPDAVSKGLLSQVALDRAAGNVLRSKFASGLFERPLVNDSLLPLINTPASRALARRAVAEGAVLLKNEGNLLPLSLDAAHPTTIAIVGPLAGCADGSSTCSAILSQSGGYTNHGVDVISFLAAAANESGVIVRYAAGCEVGGQNKSGFAGAVAAAAAADVVIFLGGDSGGLGWNKNTCGEDDDRADLDLPGVQADLVLALAATGKPLAVILIHGRPVTFVRNNPLPNITALIAAWRPGCEGGNGLWDIVSGRTSPSGRLAQAWVRSVGHVKSQTSPWYGALQGDFDQVDYNGDIIAAGGPTPFSSISPLFPFGAGLSYTSFSLDLISVVVSADSIITTTINVTNTGAVASKEVCGVYYSKPLSSFVRPAKSLLTFGKTPLLSPLESITLQLATPVDSLSSYDPRLQQQVVEPGAYSISIGPDSVTVSGSATITL